MEYPLGITKLITSKNKIIITADDAMTIVIETNENNSFSYNKCRKQQKFESVDVTISKDKGTDKIEPIMGFSKCITNLALLIKKHIIINNIKREDLSHLYNKLFLVIKSFLS